MKTFSVLAPTLTLLLTLLLPINSRASEVQTAAQIAESQKIQPGDLERPIFVADSVQWGTPHLYMKLRTTLEPGILQLAHFYWSGFINRQTNGNLGSLFKNVRFGNAENLYVNPSNGYVYLGNQLIGGIYRLPDLNILAVVFKTPMQADLKNGVVKLSE